MPLLTDQKDRGDDEEPRGPDEPPEYAMNYLFSWPANQRRDVERMGSVFVLSGVVINFVALFVMVGNLEFNVTPAMWLLQALVILTGFYAFWEVWPRHRQNSWFTGFPGVLVLAGIIIQVFAPGIFGESYLIFYSVLGSLTSLVGGLLLAWTNRLKNSAGGKSV